MGIAVLGFMLLTKQYQGGNQGGNQIETSSSICFIARPTNGRDSVKIRSDANDNAEVNMTIPDGTKVSYLNEQQGAFYKVKLSDESEGWVYNNQVQPCYSPQGSNNSQGLSQPVNNNPISTNNTFAKLEGGFGS
ncbi:MAG: SH3 domain-containing protein, partial [Synechocystis sp.]